MKFTILVYGCQMNYSDSARIKSILLNCGFKYVSTVDEAEIVIFDTCSVRQKSEDKITGKLKEISKTKKIWLCGCMVQHNLKLPKLSNTSFKKGNLLITNNYGNFEIIGLDKLDKDFKIDRSKRQVLINNSFNPLFNILKSSFQNLELFFRVDDVGYLPSILNNLGYDVNQSIDIINEYTNIVPQQGGINMSQNNSIKTAFVPIQTGCSQFCSYCIVPYARGFEKNRPIDEILNEVKYHLNQGIEEITLLGQIVNKHPEFYNILKEILKIKGLKWLRYTSPYPTFYDDNIFSLHENEQVLCPHIHIPLQSGSDKILKKMFRGYNSEQFQEFLTKIHGLNRKISIHTDIIVGFCDETNDDFNQTLKIVKYGKFDMIYIGIYSPRPGTYAAQKYIDNIDKQTKHDRWDKLNNLLSNISLSNNQKEVGKSRGVMVTKYNGKEYSGYTDNMKNVIFENNTGKNISIGKIIDVQINKAESLKLYGII